MEDENGRKVGIFSWRSLISIKVRKKYWVTEVGLELGNHGGRAGPAGGQARGDKV